MASVFKRGGKKAKGPYYASWTDHTGKRVTKCTSTTDKATAERIARKYEADAALRREGVIDPAVDTINREGNRLLESHLADFENKMLAANRTAKHIRNTMNFIRQIADYAGFEVAMDINADGVNRYAGKLRDEGRAARTIQAHLNAITAFTKWLTENQKLARDPLVSVKKPSPKADRRRERRVLLPEEWRLLERAADSGPDRYGMPGAERSLLYRTAIETALRSKELRSLTRGRLFLESDQPYLTCKAGSTKNRKDAKQYIQPDLAQRLKAHISSKAPKAALFAMPHETNLARMLRDDLSDARSRWLGSSKSDPQLYAQRQESDFLVDVNHEGEMIDFHSLRHTCGAWLAMTGVQPKVVQQVMRHQSITLTMDTYGHLFPGQEAEAVGRLYHLFAGPPASSFSLPATGTDQQPLVAHPFAQRVGGDTVRTDATPCDSEAGIAVQHGTPKSLPIGTLSDVLQEDATGCESSGRGIRTIIDFFGESQQFSNGGSVGGSI